ncbi:MAG: PGPGW domain-containing protein [Microlunatus sp.]|nr:PGPGW domain-containing protein [Microlunatus sp.]
MSAAVGDSKRRHRRTDTPRMSSTRHNRATAAEESGIDQPPDPDAANTADAAAATQTPHHRHHMLIAAEEDRWAWRRRIRQNPHRLRIYRVVVGFVGLLLLCLGIVTGPLPGPGGIPLVLLGLAIWSSEFEWAYRLRLRFKAEVRKFRGWSTGKKVAFWVVFFAACGSLAYSYLLILGVPFWMPDVGAQLLERLPGVRPTG